MGKKKLNLILLICIMLFGLFNTTSLANDENKPNISLEDTWLSADSMLKILESLKVETVNSGELCFLEYYTNFPKVIVDGEYPYIWTHTANKFSTAFNNWFHTYYYNYDVVIGDLLFYWPVYVNSANSFSASNTITIFINGSPSPFVGDFIPIGEFYSDDVSYTGGNKNFYRFSSWNYDSNNNITGYTTQQPSNNCFSLGENSVSVNNFGNTPNTSVRYIPSSFYVYPNSYIYSSTTGYLTFNNENQTDKQVAYKYYYRIPTSSNNQISYNWSYFNRKIDLGSGEFPSPTPTPSGTGGPVPTSTPGGGGSTDLTETNNLIGGISDFLSESGDSDSWGIPSSGEIVGILFPSGDSNPFDNYFTVLFNNLITVLTSTSGYNFIDVDFLGTSYRIWASDFYFDYPPLLAQLIPGVFTLGVVFAMLKFLHHIYFLIQTLKISGFSSIAEDDMSHLM